MEKPIYKYKPGSSVKHQMADTVTLRALCGVGFMWYLSNNEWWKEDKEGLESRRVCKNCTDQRFKAKDDSSIKKSPLSDSSNSNGANFSPL